MMQMPDPSRRGTGAPPMRVHTAPGGRSKGPRASGAGAALSPGAIRRGAARRKRARRKRIASLLIFLVMAGLLFFVAYLLAGGFGKAEEAVTPSQPASTPTAVSVPVSTPPAEPARIPTAYDLGAAPPLFNFENPIPASYLDAMVLKDIGGGQQMEEAAAAAYNAMSAAAEADGLSLVPVSGYRSNAQQTQNYNWSIQRYLDQGLTREKAVELTEGYYAIPGTSEHEAGLAIDIGFIEDSFDTTPEFAWLQQHCAEYGFILRYREENFAITRIHYEPWHYRFVGAEHAEKINALGLDTLEEYTAWLKENPTGGNTGASASAPNP